MSASRSDQRGDDLVARVVAWHNRHPLAWRIERRHVLSQGVLGLPFEAPAANPHRDSDGPPLDAPAAHPAHPADPPANDALDADRDAPPDGSSDTPLDAPLGTPSETLSDRPSDAAAHEAALPGVDDAAAAGDGPPEGSRLRDRAAARARAAAEHPPDGGQPSAASPAQRAAAPRAWARLKWGRLGLKAAFDPEFLSPFTAREVARWMARHGVAQRPGPAGAPVREVAALRSPYTRLWSYTAAVEVGARRQRLLISAGMPLQMLGPRLLNPWRVRLALGTGAMAFAGVAMLWSPWWGRELPSPTPAEMVALAHGAASAPAGAGSTASMAPASPASSAASAALAHGEGAASSTPASSPPSPTADANLHLASGDAHAAQSPAASGAHAAAAASSTPAHANAHPRAEPGQTLAQAAQASSAATATPAASRREAMRGKPRVVAALDEGPRRAAWQAGEAARAEHARLRGQAYEVRPWPGDAPPAAEGAPASLVAVAAQDAPHTPHAAKPGNPADHAPPATAPAPAAQPTPKPPSPAATPVAANAVRLPAPGSGAWAIRTRVLRTRFESDQLAGALREVAAQSGRGLKVDVIAAGEDWRAVGWPFETRAQAEALKAELAGRGLRVEVVAF